MNLEMSDLASAYAMVSMQVDERAEFDSEEEYFEALYNVDLQKLADIFTSFVADDFSLETAFLAASFLYELGRKQEQVIHDTITT